MGVTTNLINKPFNPRAQDQSPKGYNRAKLYSGKALDFDGVNDYVDIGSFSMSGNNATFVFNYNQDAAASSKFVFDNEGARVSIGQGDVSGSFGIDTGSIAWKYFGSLESNKWYGISITIEGSTARCYANGVPFGDAVDIGETLNFANVTNATIGARYSKTAANFDGQLTNFKIFNTALTAAQVADLYNNPEKVVPTGVDNTALKLWLPMMEGAGTTAYDGSGNGNHGTISGATYVNGVGAPVSQSAVIDWNKGQNVIKKSESFLSSYYSNQNITVTADQITAPDGDNNGYKFVASNANTFHLCNQSAAVSAGVYTQSLFAKAGEYEHIYLVLRTDGGAKRYGVKFNLTNGTFVDDIEYGSPTNTGYAISDAGNGWYRCSVTSNHSSGNIIAVFGPSDGGSLSDINNVFQGDGTSGIYAWGLQAEIAASVGAYIPNPSDTRITSDVLLPQGLTTGRDITGVNLFENVRKQGALNLDGNSWAEVHDNASLDVTTGVSVEAWIYIEDNATQGRILNKWGGSGADRSYQIFMNNALVRFLIGDGTSQNGLNSATSLSVGNWHHIVGTYDSTNIKIYIDGSEDASVAETFALVDSSETLYIGTYYNQTNTSVNPLAQPRIYNRALTAEEVQRSYDSGKNIFTNS